MIALTMVTKLTVGELGLAAWFAAGVSGCAFSTTSSELRVRDTRQVAVQVYDEGALPGAAMHDAVPAGGAPADEVVYTYENFVGADEQVHLVRRGDGAIALTCPRCWARRHEVMLLSPDGTTKREQAQVSTKGSDAVLPMGVRLDRSSLVAGAYITPWSNVIEVRERRGADPRLVGGTASGIAVVALGAVIVALGTTLVVVGATSDDLSKTQRAGYVVTGSIAAAIGLGMDVYALWHLLGPSTTRVIPPRAR
jgi:hypothetical protein